MSSSPSPSPQLPPFLPKLSPKRLRVMAKGVSFLPTPPSSLEKHKKCRMNEVWNEQNLATVETLAEQMYRLKTILDAEHEKVKAADPSDTNWLFKYFDIGDFLGISLQHANNLCKS